MMGVEDCPAKIKAAQVIEGNLEERLVQDWEKGLGFVTGQGQETGSLSGRQDHGFHYEVEKLKLKAEK
jgi:hypothetical protein